MIAVRPDWDLLPRDVESVVAVSGGPDSTALLVAAAARRRIVAAHFNHALRGADADADAAFVADLAARLHVPFVMEKADPPAGPDENRARTARYDFLLRVARSHGCPVVAVAHTADDQAETFLMRLIRGSGTLGLGAMAPSRPLTGGGGRGDGRRAGRRKCGSDGGREYGSDAGAQVGSARAGFGAAGALGHALGTGSGPSAHPSGGGAEAGRDGTDGPTTLALPGAARAAAVPDATDAFPRRPASLQVALVRPFLGVTRAEVLAYLKRKRIAYRVDASNYDTARLRARVRAELLPQLRTYNPRIVAVLCRTAAHLREDQQALEGLVALKEWKTLETRPAPQTLQALQRLQARGVGE